MSRWWWCWVAVLGCTPGEPLPSTTTTSGEISEPEVCTNEPELVLLADGVPLVAGQLVEVVAGLQGGVHLEVSGVVAGSSGEVLLTLSVVLADGTELTNYQPQYPVALNSQEPCEGSFEYQRAYLTYMEGNLLDYYCGLRGQSAELCAEVVLQPPERRAEQCVEVVISDVLGRECL